MSATVSNLLPVLKKAVDNEDYNLILSLTEQILKISPNDIDIEEIRSVSFLLSEQYKECINFIDTKTDEKLVLYKAYALYKLRQDVDVIDYIKHSNIKNNEDLNHIHAQALYRLNNGNDSIKLYNYKNTDDAELASNYLACKYLSDNVSFNENDFNLNNNESYELEYNKACCLIQLGLYNEALNKLELAEKLCKSILSEEGYSKIEIDQELIVIYIQKAYIYQLLTNDQQSKLILNKLLTTNKINDHNANAVIYNNLISLRLYKEKLFDSLHQYDKILINKNKANAIQQETFLYNKLILLCISKQYDKANKLLKEYTSINTITQQPYVSFSHKEDYMILLAMITPDKAIDILKQYIKQHKNEKNDHQRLITLQLMLAQIYINNQQYQAAIDILYHIKLIQYKPAWVATLVALYKLLHDDINASSLLNKSIAYWSNLKNKKIMNNSLIKRYILL